MSDYSWPFKPNCWKLLKAENTIPVVNGILSSIRMSILRNYQQSCTVEIHSSCFQSSLKPQEIVVDPMRNWIHKANTAWGVRSLFVYLGCQPWYRCNSVPSLYVHTLMVMTHMQNFLFYGCTTIAMTQNFCDVTTFVVYLQCLHGSINYLQSISAGIHLGDVPKCNCSVLLWTFLMANIYFVNFKLL